jgi:hypothetical protein
MDPHEIRLASSTCSDGLCARVLSERRIIPAFATPAQVGLLRALSVVISATGPCDVDDEIGDQ